MFVARSKYVITAIKNNKSAKLTGKHIKKHIIREKITLFNEKLCFRHGHGPKYPPINKVWFLLKKYEFLFRFLVFHTSLHNLL